MYDLTQRERRRQRPGRLMLIQEQIADGRLEVRQASDEERERWRGERDQRRPRHLEQGRCDVIPPPPDPLDRPPREGQ
jgi:hypothetical protein